MLERWAETPLTRITANTPLFNQKWPRNDDHRFVDEQMIRWTDDCYEICRGTNDRYEFSMYDDWIDVAKMNEKALTRITSQRQQIRKHMWSMADAVGARRCMEYVRSVLDVRSFGVWNMFRYVEKYSNWIRISNTISVLKSIFKLLCLNPVLSSCA